MKCEVVYVIPLRSGYGHYAERFLGSYLDFPPGLDHKSTVVCNDCPPDIETTALFSVLPNLNLIHYPGQGRDIGAYQFASQSSEADMIVFFNSSVYLKRPGWLIRMAAVFMQNPNALYGTMGNKGDARCNVWPHIRTVGFWCSPSLFNAYPHKVTSPDQRYPYEHGQNCLSEWVKRQGKPVLVASWDGVYPWAEWDDIPGGFHRGNQSNLLCGDRITEPPYHTCP